MTSPIKYSLRRSMAIVAMFAMIFGLNFGFVRLAKAATITSAKDTLSTLVDSANANHTISWVSPSGVANAATITITFPTGSSLTGVIEDDIDIAGSTEGELTTAADCTGAEKASAVISGQVLTFTLCSGDGGDFTGAETITIEIGDHALSSGTGANQINNQTAAQNTTDPTIDITSGASDVGSVAVEVIADDSVNVTATVDPSITFSISDVAIGFGTLTSGAVRYATGNAAGGTTETTAAHTMSAGTNGFGGLVVTYSGALLTSAANTIDAATSVTPPGNTAIEQFAIAVDDNGAVFTIPAGYDQVTPLYSYVASATPTTLFSSGGAVASSAVDVHYLANIAANTQAGNYSTDITYIATGTF